MEFCLSSIPAISLGSRTVLLVSIQMFAGWINVIFWCVFLLGISPLAYMWYPKWCWLFRSCNWLPQMSSLPVPSDKKHIYKGSMLFKSVWFIPQSTCNIFSANICLNLNSEENLSNMVLGNTSIFPFLDNLVFQHFKCGRCHGMVTVHFTQCLYKQVSNGPK